MVREDVTGFADGTLGARVFACTWAVTGNARLGTLLCAIGGDNLGTMGANFLLGGCVVVGRI